MESSGVSGAISLKSLDETAETLSPDELEWVNSCIVNVTEGNDGIEGNDWLAATMAGPVPLQQSVENSFHSSVDPNDEAFPKLFSLLEEQHFQAIDAVKNDEKKRSKFLDKVQQDKYLQDRDKSLTLLPANNLDPYKATIFEDFEDTSEEEDEHYDPDFDTIHNPEDDDIFRVWDLETEAYLDEEDELTAQFKKAIQTEYFQESLNQLIAGISDISL